ncbi:hypothetical protein [Streptomyces sp. NPDC090056]|uniref:hypothetical protein n=1 Tax=Streptomyces sp. NPDC090056 TaxID=3365934 RepID=UPI0037F6772C
MPVHMWWSIGDVAHGGQRVSDVTAAVAALDQSVHRIEGWPGKPAELQGLAADADAMVTRMLDEGRQALEEGRSWSARVGAVVMELSRFHPE